MALSAFHNTSANDWPLLPDTRNYSQQYAQVLAIITDVQNECRHKMLQMALCAALLTLGTFGNVRALYRMWKPQGPQRMTRDNSRNLRKGILKLSLLVADCFVVFLYLPSEMFWLYFTHWYAGDVMCRLVMFLHPLGFYAMSFTVLAIAYDRMFYAKSAILYHYWQKRMRTVLACIWTLATAFSLPQAVIHGAAPRHGTHPEADAECVVLSAARVDIIVRVVSTALLFWLPLAGMVAAYGIICRLVTRSLQYTSCHGVPLHNLNNANDTRPFGRKTYKVSTKARRLASGVIIPYILCWTPFQCLTIWQLLDPSWFDSDKNMKMLASATLMLCSANACINPFLYAKMER